jgi:hypothetical protein
VLNRRKKPRLRCSVSALLLLITSSAFAVDFKDGSVHDISTPLLNGAGNARVSDSTLGDPTTLNARNGAVINGVQVNDFSIANIYDGADIKAALDAQGSSAVTIYGGTLIDADALENAVLTISGGSFAGGGGRTVGAFDQATVNISGDPLFGASTFAILSSDDSTINVAGGAINGEVQAAHNSQINIHGGTGISKVTSLEQAMLKIYGLNFDIESIGPVSLAVPFVIADNTYNTELLTGTLEDGSPISADIFNGIAGSQIVLLQAVPVPAAAWLFGSALVALCRVRKAATA